MNPDQAKALREPFPASLIGKLPRKDKFENEFFLDYVGHAAVTDRLLQVDPEWTWEPMDPPAGFDPAAGIWIRLTIGGVTRIGFGETSGGFSEADKIKAGISDAIRNAAMRFGVALDLWMKDDVHASSPSAQAPQERKHYTRQTAGNNHGDPITERQRKLVYARLKSAGIHGGAVPEFLSTVTGRDVATIDELRKGDLDDVLAKIEAFRSVDDMWAGE